MACPGGLSPGRRAAQTKAGSVPDPLALSLLLPPPPPPPLSRARAGGTGRGCFQKGGGRKDKGQDWAALRAEAGTVRTSGKEQGRPAGLSGPEIRWLGGWHPPTGTEQVPTAVC